MAIAIMGGVLGLLVLVLILIKSGTLFITIEHVPDGTEWRSHYRQMKSNRRKKAGPITWLLMGLGVAIILIGAVVSFLLT